MRSPILALLPAALVLAATIPPAPAGVAAEGAPLAPGLLSFLEGKAVAQAIVRFDADRIGVFERLFVATAGLKIVDELTILPAALVEGVPSAILALANAPNVAYVEPNLPLEYDLNAATVASRAKAVWDDPTAAQLSLPALRDDNGNVIDGRGVSVAVVDTGVNAYHPDLLWHVKVVQNLFPVSAAPGQEPPNDPMAGSVAAWVNVPETAGIATHGQHVASIVAGSGLASDGKYRGAAPGASIVAFGDGAGIGLAPFGIPVYRGLWYAAKAWEFVYLSGHSVSPPIKIITNSWGYAHGPCNPFITLSILQRALVLDRGIVMVFSAGNAFGTGTTDNVRTQPHCGPEGVLGVANFDRLDPIGRAGHLRDSSSRGLASNPVSWPDVSAPGHNTVSAVTGIGDTEPDCDMADVNPCTDNPLYSHFGGTSAAAPHVAGIVALLLQANPGLTPAEVECLIEQTAFKFDPNGQPFPPDGPYASGFGDARFDGSNVGRGHGLIDAHAAVSAALDLKHQNLVGAAWKCQEADPFTGAVR